MIPDLINEFAGDAELGMTKDALWKALINSPSLAEKPNQQTFGVRLSKLVKTKVLETVKGRYRLTKAYMEKRIKQLEKGSKSA